MLAGGEGLFGEGEVGLVGGGDDDELDFRVCQQFFDGTDGLAGGVRLRCFVGLAFDEGYEFEAGYSADEGCVKDFCCESESDDAYADVCCHFDSPDYANFGETSRPKCTRKHFFEDFGTAEASKKGQQSNGQQFVRPHHIRQDSYDKRYAKK